MPRKPENASYRSEKADEDSDYEDISEEDVPMPASQESTSSDGPNLESMLSLVAQLRDNRTKKKREGEKRFLQAAKKKTTDEIQQTLDQVTAAAQTIDEAYTKFMVDYASIEDLIRKKWVEIQQEQDNLLYLIVQGVQASAKAGVSAEQGHIQGMTSMKQACEDMVDLIGSLSPTIS